jgi:hypothetical protein
VPIIEDHMAAEEIMAGRELDALVAEKVFGETVVRADSLWVDDGEGEYTDNIAIERRVTKTHLRYVPGSLQKSRLGEYIDTGEPVHQELPEYSTNIAAAWEVVEKFEPFIRLECYEDSDVDPNPKAEGWHVDIWHDKGLACVRGETAPLAVCRAALKAVCRI